MLKWIPSFSANDEPHILCLGAHCDDIEIGCGGLISQVARSYPRAIIDCVVFSSNDLRRRETKAAISQLLGGHMPNSLQIADFRNSYFPSQFAAIKDYFEDVKRDKHPDLVLTHYRDDRHQDHSVISDLTWNTFRNHAILEYEIPKFDGDIGNPNTYIPLEKSVVEEKIRCLMDCFPSQAARDWFSDETFRALMRIRGIECNSESGYAEAFFGRKLRLEI
jgi:LmbE family N-acetylglucosaminyl deacetylase